MKGDKDRVLECTTSAFDGLVAMVNPQDSWVVRIRTASWRPQSRLAAADGLPSAPLLLTYQARYQRVGA